MCAPYRLQRTQERLACHLGGLGTAVCLETSLALVMAPLSWKSLERAGPLLQHFGFSCKAFQGRLCLNALRRLGSHSKVKNKFPTFSQLKFTQFECVLT